MGEVTESVDRMTEEIRALRQEIRDLRGQLGRLDVSLRELAEGLPDSDEGWQLRPEVREDIERSLATPREALLTPDEAWNRLLR